jgi:hypothetical protein
MKRGRTKRWIVTVKVAGEVRNVTWDTFFFTVKQKFSEADNAALFQLTLGTGITLYAPTLGKIMISIAPEDTENCPAQRTVYQYDLSIVYNTGEKYTLTEGTLAVEPDVTNSTM